jgi:hypothetical protein
MVHFTRALLVAALTGGAACSVYDRSLTYSNNSADSSVADACTPELELCNGKDDDCDGTTDEVAEAVANDCVHKVVHAASTCTSGLCVKLGRDCYDGYYNCDGLPNNGCESSCPCGQECDEDAGPRAP